jgi:hypothetical protein
VPGLLNYSNAYRTKNKAKMLKNGDGGEMPRRRENKRAARVRYSLVKAIIVLSASEMRGDEREREREREREIERGVARRGTRIPGRTVIFERNKSI